jgi:hypothetical protein
MQNILMLTAVCVDEKPKIGSPLLLLGWIKYTFESN